MNILYTAYYGLGIGGAEVSMNLLARALEKKHNIIVSSSGEYKGFRNYKFSKYIKYVPSFYLQNKYLSTKMERIKVNYPKFYDKLVKSKKQGAFWIK